MIGVSGGRVRGLIGCIDDITVDEAGLCVVKTPLSGVWAICGDVCKMKGVCERSPIYVFWLWREGVICVKSAN